MPVVVAERERLSQQAQEKNQCTKEFYRDRSKKKGRKQKK